MKLIRRHQLRLSGISPRGRTLLTQTVRFVRDVGQLRSIFSRSSATNFGIAPFFYWLLVFVPLMAGCSTTSLQGHTESAWRSYEKDGGTSECDHDLQAARERLWKNIRATIDNPDLSDFSKIVKSFNFETSLPLDYINSRTEVPNWRTDARASDGLVSSMRYGIFFNNLEKKTRMFAFDIDFNLAKICIKPDDIKEAYPSSISFIPVDARFKPGMSLDGQYYVLYIKDKRATFYIEPSGCASTFRTSQLIN